MFVTNSDLFINQPDMVSKVKPYYNEAHRFYHNWDHIVYGFLLFDKIPDFNLDLTSELAWIFHDVIYLPFNLGQNNPNHTNEKLSAQFLEFFLTCNYPDFYKKYPHAIQEAQKIILGTEQHIPYDERSSIIFDVDMSYLGYQFEDYQKIRQLVRKEYQFVSDEVFNKGTLHFIETLLKQEKIYFSEYGFQTWEKKARENLQKNKELILEVL